MDIRKLVDSSSTVELCLKGPDGETNLGIKLQIRSSESDEVKRAVRMHSDQLLASRKKRLTAAKLEAEMLDTAAAAVASWDWSKNHLGLELDGDKNPPCTPENVQAMVQIGWVFEQITSCMEDRGNFSTKSAKP